MMRRPLLCLLLCAATLLGAEFWDAKEPSEWTGAEVETLLKDSPWAITKTIAQGAILGPKRVAPRRRVRIGSSPNTITFTVRWLSAQPVRDAFQHYMTMQGRGRQQSRQVETMLGHADTHYLIMVADMPAKILTQTDATEPKLKQGSLLKVKGKFELPAARVEMRRGGGQGSMIFYFPRRDDISIKDKKIEFHMKIGSTTIKREFKPAEMIADSKLAL
jgi:hypothetical protein